MQKRAIHYVLIIMFTISFAELTLAQEYLISQEDVNIIGRGEVEWNDQNITISDCLIAHKKKHPEKFKMTFSVMATENCDQVQAWSGFGFHDRDNRYALGLRGGNNNDLYLCRYQSKAKNKMLALESLDFSPIPGEWYNIKIVFWEGNIRVYLNDETAPRIAIRDENYLKGGSVVLGGGWLSTQFKELRIKELTESEIIAYNKDSIAFQTFMTIAEKNIKRKQERTTYQPVKILKINPARTEISLNGNWLFMPGYEVQSTHTPYQVDQNDESWHVMPVPSFWNPVRNWLHLQDSHLPHRGSGISDNYREKEESRCEAYTFDYKKTTSAWYRHWIDIPENLDGKSFSLYFEAVSKIADLYVNGKYVGGHVGMFGDFEYDISSFIKPGKNLIALGVKVRKDEKTADAEKNVARAVSVDITNDMLNSLPSGMFRGDEGGIWQGVKMIITDPVSIEDVYANVEANGGNIEVTLNNSGRKTDTVDLQVAVIDQQTQKLLFESLDNKTAILEAGNKAEIIFSTGHINPRTWSPETPNMYTLVTKVLQHGKVIDETKTQIGFRTFEAIGNKFYLNGNPYWLRGANHPPCGIAPNDKALANSFFKLMHDGNQMLTRSHGCPFTKAWMDAADKEGVGVSYEGSWPWLMIGNIPSGDLLDVWKKEMLSLVKKYRNHPSLLIWTINNEMYFTMFYKNDPPEVRQKKWAILSKVIKEIRKLSPNTVISGDSGYSRLTADYEQNLAPNDFDDGDIDDRHVYFNWYNRDFFQVFDGEWAKRIYWSPGANPDRPFFSQETSTGYTNNDDGHFNRKYLFNNYVPQAWVGDWAYEDKDPAYSLQRHAFMSKELFEVIRRTSPESAGVLLFANVCWFKNVFDAENIEPYPVYKAFKTASQPVLVSAELFGRNYYAGDTIMSRVCLVNDDINGNSIPPSQLEWKVMLDESTLSTGKMNLIGVDHYDRSWTDVKLHLPKQLPVQKAKCTLFLSVRSQEEFISENTYEITIADKAWASGNGTLNDKAISVFDLTGATTDVLDHLGIQYRELSDLTEIRTTESDLIIIANLDQDDEIPYNWEDVKSVCGNGTNVLLVHPGKHLQWLYYDQIASVYERKGRVVNMHIPEHTAFNAIGPMEVAWWQQDGREKPRACRRSFRLKTEENIQALCTYLRPHTGLGSDPEAYLEEMSGIPLLEIKTGKGRLIASEMETNQGIKDPIAGKLFMNLIKDLLE